MPDIFTAHPKEEPKQDAPEQLESPARPEQQQVQAEESLSQQEHVQAKQRKPLSTSLPHPDITTTPGLFSAYCPNPRGIKFINQENDEEPVLFLRRHFITNFPWICFSFIFLLIPPFLFAIINVFNFQFLPIPPQMTFVIVAFYYLLVFNYALTKFIVWFYHVGIVTQKRLLDLDVDNILHYHLAETEMGDIVDVSYTEKGFFQSFFNFGDVHIQTEAIKANFQFEQTPKPAPVADIITDLRPELKGSQHNDA